MDALSIKRTFAKYVSLNVLGTIGFSCYILADTFFIARGIGAEGLTALNIALPVFNVIFAFGMMVGLGGATRYTLSKSKTIFTQSFYLLSVGCLLFTAFGLLFTERIAVFLGADASIAGPATTYLRVIFAFTPAFMLNNFLQNFVRNDGYPSLVMTAMLLGSFSNILLDYIFIYPCNMGMYGAALATGCAPIVGIIMMSLHFLRRRNTFKLCRCRPQLGVMGDIASLGLSTFVTEISSGVVILVYNLVVLRIAGNTGVAAYGVVANIALVVMAVFIGMSQGVQPVASTLFREQNRSGLQRVVRYSIVVSLALSVGIFLVSFFFAGPIVTAFNKEGDILLQSLGEAGMRIYFLAYLFAGINILIAALLSAVDAPKPAFLISILRGFAVLVPMVLLMSHLLGMTGVWIAMICSEAIVLIYTIAAFRKSVFVRKNVNSQF